MVAKKPTHLSTVAPSAADAGSPAKSRIGFDRFSWDNLRLFLAVAEAGSFRSAASLAGVSINTIRTKVERLERQIGGPLLRRSVEGVALTQDGRELLQIARDMRELGRTTARVQPGESTRPERVRIVATEGIGTAWIVPRIAMLQAQQPDLKISLCCDMNSADVLFRDVDIAIQIEEPTDPDLSFERLGTLHVMPFASRSYVDRYGVPQSLNDLGRHHLVRQILPASATVEFPEFALEALEGTEIAVETNTSTSHYWAIANGAGIGFLPTYVRALNSDLCPINVGLATQCGIYMVHHEDLADDVHVATVRSWLRGIFDNQTHPWFASNFVDPAAFEPDPKDTVAHILTRPTIR